MMHFGNLPQGHVVSPPKRGWSVEGELITGNVDREVSLSQKFDDAGMHTVQFSLQPIDDPQTDVVRRCEATIRWQVGNTVTRVVTVATGVSVSGVGDSVSIVMKDATIEEPGPVAVQAKRYRVAANIAPGTRAETTNPPILNKPIPIVGGGESASFSSMTPGDSILMDVPQDAGINSVRVTAVETTHVALAPECVIVTQFVGAAFAIKEYSWNDGERDGWTPLEAGVTAIGVRVNSGAGPVLTEVAVYIEFGIDG